ncbi:unnamed protein product [Laminaria digitata]
MDCHCEPNGDRHPTGALRTEPLIRALRKTGDDHPNQIEDTNKGSTCELKSQEQKPHPSGSRRRRRDDALDLCTHCGSDQRDLHQGAWLAARTGSDPHPRTNRHHSGSDHTHRDRHRRAPRADQQPHR